MIINRNKIKRVANFLLAGYLIFNILTAFHYHHYSFQKDLSFNQEQQNKSVNHFIFNEQNICQILFAGANQISADTNSNDLFFIHPLEANLSETHLFFPSIENFSSKKLRAPPVIS